MTEQFIRYMREQPALLRTIAAERETLAAPLLQSCTAPPERVFLIGSGSSYNAACAVMPLLRTMLRCEITCLTPTMLATYPSLPEGLALVLSQTGRSTNTLAAVRQLQQQGRHVILVTAEPDSPVGRQADGCLVVPCGAERVGPKTKGATATMLVLLATFYALAQRLHTADAALLDRLGSQFEQVADDVSAALASGEAFFPAHRQELVVAPFLLLCADSAGLGAGQECALKLLETCWLPVFCYEAEEFMHGIHYTDGPGTTIFFLFTPQPGERERMERIARFSQKNGAQVYCLETSAGQGEGHLIADCCELSRPLCFTAFFQALCAQLSQAKGIDCDVPRYPNFGKIMDTKTFI